MNKYKVGDYVVLDKIFTPKLTQEGSNYDYSRGEIIVKVVEVHHAVSMGYNYKLESLDDTDLGGVLYWESDIVRKSDVDHEHEFWKAWGDR